MCFETRAGAFTHPTTAEVLRRRSTTADVDSGATCQCLLKDDDALELAEDGELRLLSTFRGARA
jgi:hypothetical protein